MDGDSQSLKQESIMNISKARDANDPELLSGKYNWAKQKTGFYLASLSDTVNSAEPPAVWFSEAFS